MTFEELNLSPALLAALESEKYTKPTPIQEQAIPAILNKKDILGRAQTGTGKTAAFALPVLQLLENKGLLRARKHDIQVLVLVPTRELAIQVSESFKTYGKNLHVKTVAVYGGVEINGQNSQLRGGTDILVATPGRLIDMVKARLTSLKKVDILILDEADRMFDMGFINDVKKIIPLLTSRKQTLLFSATLHEEVDKLAKTILRNPESLDIAPAAATAEIIQQKVFFLEPEDKPALLLHILKNRDIKSALVFTKTKSGADKLVEFLNEHRIWSNAIHGDKDQRERERLLEKFKNKKLRVLVATDIAARGLDIEGLKYVVNYDLPHLPENYVHRIGRTGRAEVEGFAYSFCDADELDYLRAIEKLIDRSLDVASHPYKVVFRSFEKLPITKEHNRNNARTGTSKESNGEFKKNTAKKKSPSEVKKHYRSFKK